MAKVRGVDAKLARLRAVRTGPVTPAVLAELRDALADKSNFVAAAAAEIIAERNLMDLVPDLEAAFRRFLVDPVETDKLCRAKIAITEVLNQGEADAEEVFRLGLRHVQPEPRWGGADDTADAKIASSVPHTLNLPGISCVEPRNAAANAGSRSVPPKSSEGPFSDENMMPARPAMLADVTSARVV